LLTTPARHYAVSHKFSPNALKVTSEDNELVIQYEVKFEKNLECGGAYIKLLENTESLDPATINNDSPYIIMFGPDLCGATNKVHFIFRHQNPKNGEWEEKHLKDTPRVKNDQLSHVYTLIVRKDQTFEILIDQVSAKSGSLLLDFAPPVNPPKEIDDPSDIKPADWVDDEFIPDPTATKPDDWDESQPEEIIDESDVKPDDWFDNEPELVKDPESVKPIDWDDEEDGLWEGPMIRNPKCAAGNCGKWEPRTIKNPWYKGKWVSPKITNPEYKGEWHPSKIPNPNYFEDSTPNQFPEIGAIAIEIWTMQGNVLFDNFLISFDEEVAKSYAQATWAGKFEQQKLKQPKVEEESAPFSTGNEYLDTLIDQAKAVYDEYPILFIGGTVLAILISIPLLFCMRGGSGKKKESKFTSEESKSEEVAEVETQEEQKEEKSSSLKKKKSKAKRTD
jgi:calnexin